MSLQVEERSGVQPKLAAAFSSISEAASNLIVFETMLAKEKSRLAELKNAAKVAATKVTSNQRYCRNRYRPLFLGKKTPKVLSKVATEVLHCMKDGEFYPDAIEADPVTVMRGDQWDPAEIQVFPKGTRRSSRYGKICNKVWARLSSV